MVQNWDRYCGTPDQFDEAAEEIIRFTQLDVRNRIVRRFPFTETANKLRAKLFLGAERQWTRAGMLEKYYERFLYGDTPLSQLPKSPRLHILATNLSEGSICSFNRNGLLINRRVAGRRDKFERVEVGLATIPMAVAASSCFPGFFPPLELTSWDVGADIGAFSRMVFTDGGVYDNLGLRMFRYLQQSSMQQDAPLEKNDFLDFEDTMSALFAAEDLPDESPLRKLRKLVDGRVAIGESAAGLADGQQFNAAMVHGLWEVIRSEQLYRDPVLANLELEDSSAQSLLSYIRDSRRDPEMGDRLWLNRMIVESVLSQVIGKPCMRPGKEAFDGILVSDAGGKFKVSRNVRGGGLISTALRSSDILMDRVWQLEAELFEHSPGVVPIPITEVVTPTKNQLVLDTALQKQAAKIRTDLDYFSDLEVSSLVQHGYGVAQQICRRHGEIFGGDPGNCALWDPMSRKRKSSSKAESGLHGEQNALATARQLRKSSKRKVVSTLLSWRDWPSYMWLALFVLIVVGVPYLIWERSERLKQQETILSAVAELDPNYRRIVDLLQTDTPPAVNAMEYATVDTLGDPQPSGFEVISESRVFDLRGWGAEGKDWHGVGYNRTRVRRSTDASDRTEIRLQRDLADENYIIECRSDRLNPKLSRMKLGENLYRWELCLDLSHLPLGSNTEIVTRAKLPRALAANYADEGRFNFTVPTSTGLMQVWILMPEGRNYSLFEVSSHPIGKPELSEVIVPAATVKVTLESVVTFRLINPEPNRRYECRWKWDN